MKNHLIIGTDTGVGKTYFTCLLLRHFHSLGIKVAGLKPICCGDSKDISSIYEACGRDLAEEKINSYRFKSSLSPYGASLLENRKIDLDILVQHYQEISRQYSLVFVEGVGGMEVPLTEEWNFSDYAQRLKIPAFLVVGNRLGTLNHTLLTLQSLKARNIECTGLILNSIEEERGIVQTNNRAILEKISPVPIVADLLYNEDELVFERDSFF